MTTRKPRLSYGNGVWECAGNGKSGYGRSPASAYSDWRFKNVALAQLKLANKRFFASMGIFQPHPGRSDIERIMDPRTVEDYRVTVKL